MNRPMPKLVALAAALTVFWPALVFSDDPPAAAASTAEAPAAATETAAAETPPGTVAELGAISVEGTQDQQKIIHALQTVKRGLTTALSNDPAHADDVVCRMSYVTGYPTNIYLRCSTNREIAQQRREMQATHDLHGGGGTDQAMQVMALMHVMDPGRFYAKEVNAAKFQALLKKIHCAGCKENGLVIGAGGD